LDIDNTADQIAALASKTDDKIVAQYVIALQNEVGLLRRIDYAKKHKQSTSFLRSALDKTRETERKLAGSYGFQVCSSG